MKKHLLTILLSLPLFLAAQSLEIVYADSLVKGNASTSGDIYGYIHIKNTAKVDQNVLVKRIDGLGYTNLTDSNAICWDQCFNPDVSVAPHSIKIKAEQTNTSDFVGHVYPDKDGMPATGSVTYVFYVEFNETDSVAFTMNFEVTQDFDLEENQAANKLSVFPNPVVGKANVSYSLSSDDNNYFELYTLVGTKVLERKIEEREGEFEFDASGFDSGVYFYTLKSDGKIIETRKMVIK